MNSNANLPTADQLALILRAFKIFDGFGAANDDLWWRTGPEPEYAPFTLYVNCNDLFYWGMSDCEELNTDNISLLENTMAEVIALYDPKDDDLRKAERYAPLLWCCRSRKQRPQTAYYKYFPEKMKPLFDACGPEDEQYGSVTFNAKRNEQARDVPRSDS